ncbi:hypothetical protein ACHAW6_012643 [Cyclotella cf. meneghiniana]
MKRTNPNRKKTDILIPEPRHRVGPKGVSSGISFRNLPPPSLDEIKKVCEHYQEKCAGTYKSLASRYVYQMATEIEDLVDIMKEESSPSEAFSATQKNHSCTTRAHKENANSNERLAKKNSSKSMLQYSPDSSKATHGSRPSRHSPTSSETKDACRSSRNRRPATHSEFDLHYGHQNGVRTNTKYSKHVATEKERMRWRKEFQLSHPERLCEESVCSSTCSCNVSSDDERNRQYLKSAKPQHRKMTRKLECRIDHVLNGSEEESNETFKWERRQLDEVLKWLKEEMDRSQYIIKRSKQMHNEELENAKKELEKIRKAAKIIIKAVQKKAKENAAKLEANVQSERRQRVKSDKMVECLIKSQTNQLNQLRKLTRPAEEMSESCDNRSEGIWGLMADTDLTSVLDELAEEAFQQSYCS